VGMFADLLVETNRRQTALAVPKDAVVDEGGEVVVYLNVAARHSSAAGSKSVSATPIKWKLVMACAGDRVATKEPTPNIVESDLLRLTIFRSFKVRGNRRFDGERYWLGSHRYSKKGAKKPRKIIEGWRPCRGRRTVVVVGTKATFAA